MWFLFVCSFRFHLAAQLRNVAPSAFRAQEALVYTRGRLKQCCSWLRVARDRGSLCKFQLGFTRLLLHLRASGLASGVVVPAAVCRSYSRAYFRHAGGRLLWYETASWGVPVVLSDQLSGLRCRVVIDGRRYSTVGQRVSSLLALYCPVSRFLSVSAAFAC